MDDFGQLVKHKRAQKGMSSRELSKQIGMSSAYISELERGLVKRPTYEVVKRIVDALDMNPSVLDFFGFVPAQVEQQLQQRDTQEIDHRREMEEAYVSNLSEQLKSMDLEALEALSYMINQRMDIWRKLYELSRMGEAQTIVTVMEFVDFLHTKHAVVD